MHKNVFIVISHAWDAETILQTREEIREYKGNMVRTLALDVLLSHQNYQLWKLPHSIIHSFIHLFDNIFSLLILFGLEISIKWSL